MLFVGPTPLDEMDKNNAVELVKLDNHQMVVIGRDSASDPNDITTWGENAVICDPWAGMFYETTKFYTVQEKGEKIPVIKSINPLSGEILEQDDHYLSGSPKV